MFFFFTLHLTLFLIPGVSDEAIDLTWVTAIKHFRNTEVGACFNTLQEQNAKTTKTCFQISRQQCLGI